MSSLLAVQNIHQIEKLNDVGKGNVCVCLKGRGEGGAYR